MATVIDLKELQRLPDRELLQHVLGEDVWEHITSLAHAFGLQLGDEASNTTGSGSYRLMCARELLSRALVEHLQGKPTLGNPTAVQEFLRLKIGGLSYECFWVLFIDSQNRLIRAEEMFRGTLTQTSVYPREIVKRALQLNAAAVILSHNHPSGVSEPSRADENLTNILKAGLSLVDIRVLDHIIVGDAQTSSMAAMGLM
ncbi:RadC family protein [Hydrogenophaga sp.]|uniref:JAB domain-containing protein n=1 Tax=Hydrogenophaga sp. TaxID=1904254 RepID=UPI0025C1125E|nr:DNA repair protein RadC [Hydrogenophaga sp.]